LQALTIALKNVSLQKPYTMKKATILFIFLLLASLGIQAQQYYLQGTISDSQNQERLADAQISIIETNTGTISNAKGEYRLKFSKKGSYTIRVQHINYEDATYGFEIPASTTLNIQLQPSSILLQETEIQDSICFEKSFQPTNTLSKKELQTLPHNDIGGALRNLPNVDGIRKGGQALDPVIRGFKFNQLNIQGNDGLKIEGGCPNRMDPTAAHFDLDDIERIEVIKGPFSLKYGPSLGGVVNLKTHQAMPMEDKTFTLNALKSWQTNWEGSKEHLDFALGNERIFFAASGNYKKYGDYKNGDQQKVDAAFEKYNMGASIGAQPIDGHILRFSADLSYGRNIDFPTLPMDERTDNTKLFSLDYEGKGFSNTFRETKLKIYSSDVEHIMDNKNRPFGDTVVAISSIDAKNRGGRIEQQIHAFNEDFILGIDAEYIEKDGQRTKTKIMDPSMPIKTEQLWGNAEIRNNGLFAGWEKAINQIMLKAMVRMDLNHAKSDPMVVKAMNGTILYEDMNTTSDFTNFSYSLGASYHINKDFTLDVSFGRGVRNPDMVERFITLLPVGYDNYDYLGNPQLKPESNTEADITFHYDNPQIGHILIGAFYSYVQDYITGVILPPSQIMPQTKGVLGVKQFYNADHVYLTGFEAAYRTPEQMKPSLAFTLGHTMGINPNAFTWVKQEDGTYEEEIIKNDPLPEIPPLKIKFDIGYPLLKDRLKPIATIRLAAGQSQVSKAYEEQTSEGYIVADFTMSYEYNAHFKVHAGIQNIFDKNYYEHLNRKLIDKSGPLWEPGRIFFMNLIFTI